MNEEYPDPVSFDGGLAENSPLPADVPLTGIDHEPDWPVAVYDDPEDLGARVTDEGPWPVHDQDGEPDDEATAADAAFLAELTAWGSAPSEPPGPSFTDAILNRLRTH